MNHPVFVKISDKSSFCFVNFSPFTSAEVLHSSDISPVPSLNLQQNTRGGTTKKITSSTYRKFVGATQKKKIKQTTKSKTNRLASSALLGPSKRRTRRVCRNPTPSDTPSDLETDLAVPFADGSTEEEEQDADCVLYTGRFSEDHNGEEWIRCAKHFRWAHTLCLWGLSWVNTVLFLVCVLGICNSFNSVTILRAFCVNYSPPQIRNTCTPN